MPILVRVKEITAVVAVLFVGIGLVRFGMALADPANSGLWALVFILAGVGFGTTSWYGWQTKGLTDDLEGAFVDDLASRLPPNPLPAVPHAPSPKAPPAFPTPNKAAPRPWEPAPPEPGTSRAPTPSRTVQAGIVVPSVGPTRAVPQPETPVAGPPAQRTEPPPIKLVALPPATQHDASAGDTGASHPNGGD